MNTRLKLVPLVLVLSLATLAPRGWAMTCAEFLYRTSFTREESPDYYGFTRQLLREYKNDDVFHFWVRDASKRFETLPELLANYPRVRAEREANEPRHYFPREVDLSDMERLSQPNIQFCALCPWLGGEPNTPTEYGIRVINLRRRDTVKFSDKQFTLGRFLGRGNASHVFEVESYPEAVLKLPFMAGNISGRFQKPGWTLNPRWQRSYLELAVTTLKSLPPDLPHVRVLEHGKEYEWALVTRITSDEDGRSFLRSLGSEATEAQRKKKARLLRNATRYIELAHAAGRAKKLNPENELDLFNTARQFMWHEEDWYLIDSD